MTIRKGPRGDAARERVRKRDEAQAARNKAEADRRRKERVAAGQISGDPISRARRERFQAPGELTGRRVQGKPERAGINVSERDFQRLKDRILRPATFRESTKEQPEEKISTTGTQSFPLPNQSFLENQSFPTDSKFTPEQQARIDESFLAGIKRGAPGSAGQLAGDIATVGTLGGAGAFQSLFGKGGTKIATSVDEILASLSVPGKTIAKKQQIGKAIPRIADLFKTTGSSSAAATAARFKTNLKSQGLSRNLISKIALQYKKPAFIAGAIIGMAGTFPWAEWAQGEAIEILGFTSTRAINSGDPQIIREFQIAREDILDKNVWESMARLIPGANIATGFLNKWNAMKAQVKVNIANEDKAIAQLATGETEFQETTREREIEKQELNIRRSEVFELRRLGRFPEADELELEILNELKGGGTNE